MKVHFVQYISLKPDQKFMLERKKERKDVRGYFVEMDFSLEENKNA